MEPFPRKSSSVGSRENIVIFDEVSVDIIIRTREKDKLNSHDYLQLKRQSLDPRVSHMTR